MTLQDGPETSQSSVGADLSQTGADLAVRLPSEFTCKSVLASDDDNRSLSCRLLLLGIKEFKCHFYCFLGMNCTSSHVFFYYLCRVQERSLSEQRGHTELDDAGKLPVSETFSSMHPH